MKVPALILLFLVAALAKYTVIPQLKNVHSSSPYLGTDPDSGRRIFGPGSIEYNRKYIKTMRSPDPQPPTIDQALASLADRLTRCTAGTATGEALAQAYHLCSNTWPVWVDGWFDTLCFLKNVGWIYKDKRFGVTVNEEAVKSLVSYLKDGKWTPCFVVPPA